MPGLRGARVHADKNAFLEKDLLKIPSPSSHHTAAEAVLDGEILDKDDEPIRPESTPPLHIGAIINNALRAAGLIKD